MSNIKALIFREDFSSCANSFAASWLGVLSPLTVAVFTAPVNAAAGILGRSTVRANSIRTSGVKHHPATNLEIAPLGINHDRAFIISGVVGDPLGCRVASDRAECYSIAASPKD